MSYKKNEKQTMRLQVTDGLTVTVLPNSNHEFLMPTKEVANGYGVGLTAIREHRRSYSSEFFEGKHFVKGVSISDTLPKGSQPHQIFWTKRGIVRLGFFIKSRQAKLFRDWAEDLVIRQENKQMTQTQQVKHQYAKTYELMEAASSLSGGQNRLAARLGISPAVFSHIVKRPWLVSETMVKAIETGCSNIIANENKVDTEAIEALINVVDRKARLTLYNKLKKGGLL